MKSVVLLRLLLALTLTVGLSSTQLLAQEEPEKKEAAEETAQEGQEESEKKEETEETPQQGQRGQGGGQRGQGGGQRGQGGGQRGQGGGQQGGLPDMSNLTKEERMAKLNEVIQTNVITMAEVVEIRDDQQQAFVKTQAKFEVELIKVQSQMQSAGRDRNKRQALSQTRSKAASVASKEMKKILDKAQYKAYQAKMKERTPQQRGGGRGR